MKFLTYFRAFSYAMIAVAMLALVLAGGLSYGSALIFLGVMIVSWNSKARAGNCPNVTVSPSSCFRSRCSISTGSIKSQSANRPNDSA